MSQWRARLLQRLLAVDAAHGILNQAWSPIGGITRQAFGKTIPEV